MDLQGHLSLWDGGTRDGEHFFYAFTHCNTECFQRFLKLVAQQYPDSIVVIQLDQAGWHQAKRLQVPDHIILMFQPAHSPEYNPIEQVWQYLKKRLRWRCLKTLDELRQLIKEQLLALSTETIASITGRESILGALSVAGIRELVLLVALGHGMQQLRHPHACPLTSIWVSIYGSISGWCR
ncbi:MAG: IS630 family transposase [Leptolyngbyaceae cyanobacterium]